MKNDEEVHKHYHKVKPWGLHTNIDLKDCNPETIRDAKKIKEFVHKLCDMIEMKRYGETVVVHFGEDPRVAGFSMMQLIETSLVSGHFANESNAVYLDVFSCKAYPPHKTAEFAKKFFGAKEAQVNVVFRH